MGVCSTGSAGVNSTDTLATKKNGRESIDSEFIGREVLSMIPDDEDLGFCCWRKENERERESLAGVVWLLIARGHEKVYKERISNGKRGGVERERGTKEKERGANQVLNQFNNGLYEETKRLRSVRF